MDFDRFAVRRQAVTEMGQAGRVIECSRRGVDRNDRRQLLSITFQRPRFVIEHFYRYPTSSP